MNREKFSMHEPEPEHEGDRYLRMLEMEHVAEYAVQTRDGRIIEARDFLGECGEHARDVLVAFENMDPNDPNYEPSKQALQRMVLYFAENNNRE